MAQEVRAVRPGRNTGGRVLERCRGAEAGRPEVGHGPVSRTELRESDAQEGWKAASSSQKGRGVRLLPETKAISEW